MSLDYLVVISLHISVKHCRCAYISHFSSLYLFRISEFFIHNILFGLMQGLFLVFREFCPLCIESRGAYISERLRLTVGFQQCILFQFLINLPPFNLFSFYSHWHVVTAYLAPWSLDEFGPFCV